MSASNGNGRIHMLTDKQASKLGKQNATLDEATEIAQRVAVQVMEHYMAQVPDLVGRIVEAALTAYDTSKAEQDHPAFIVNHDGTIKQAVTPRAAETGSNGENPEDVSLLPETLPVTSEGPE